MEIASFRNVKWFSTIQSVAERFLEVSSPVMEILSDCDSWPARSVASVFSVVVDQNNFASYPALEAVYVAIKPIHFMRTAMEAGNESTSPRDTNPPPSLSKNPSRHH